MLEYDRINISERIDIGFNCEANFQNSCHGLVQKAIRFNDVAIVNVKGSAYRIHIWYISKDDEMSIIMNSNLINKMGDL